MKDEAVQTLKPGKGVRMPATSGILHKLADALEQAAVLYDGADEPVDFMTALELDDESRTTYSRGNRNYAAHNKFVTINYGAGSQFRMTFSLTDQGQLTIDFREWFTAG